MFFSCDSCEENRTDSMTAITIFMSRRKMNTAYSEFTLLDSVPCSRFKRYSKMKVLHRRHGDQKEEVTILARNPKV